MAGLARSRAGNGTVVQRAALMNPNRERRRCAGCMRLFFPDPRTKQRQKFCGKAECQEARMKKNRREWLARPGNEHYWRDNQKSKYRVREWRKRNPGYWKRTRRAAESTLQEEISPKKMGRKRGKGSLERPPLREVSWRDDSVIVGIIAEITGSTLPEHIARTYRRIVAKGREILCNQKAPGVEASGAAGPKA